MNPFHDRANLRALVAALIFVIIGLVCLWISEAKWTSDSPALKGVFGQLGGLMLASIAIAMIWELFSKRALMEEMLNKARVAEDIHRNGLEGFSLYPLKGVDHTKLIKNSQQIDILVSYGGSWRNQNEWELREFAKRSGTKARVILNDPDDDELLGDLARRFGKSASVIKGLINDAISDYKKIFDVTKGATLEIWVHRRTPVYSCYRFDNVIVSTSYRYQEGRGQVPTMTCARGGDLYDFFKCEIDGFVSDVDAQKALGRKVH